MQSYPVIDVFRTGKNLQLECEIREITTRELQQFLGLTSRQSIYGWFQGKTLPTLDNFYALSRYLGVAMEELVVQKNEDDKEQAFSDKSNHHMDVHAMERRQMAYFGGLLQVG